MFRSFNTVDALGRSNIIQKDEFYSLQKKKISSKFRFGKYFVRAKDFQWIIADDFPIKISFDVTPQEAWSYFRKKAFWIAGITNQQFLDAVKFEIERAFSEGINFEEFAKSFNNLYSKFGVTAENSIKLENIWRTNLFSTYTAGQLKQVEQVRDKFPVWRCIGPVDDRNNPDHAILTDKLFRNSPLPPFWFECRHSAQWLYITQISDNFVIYNSVYDLVSEDHIINFLDDSGFQNWISKNPVSDDVARVIHSQIY